jgi:nitroreductase
MSTANPAALDFLLTRRSRPAKTLTTPVPGRGEVETLLTAAARTPDHGKLEPWRFLVLTRPALERLARAVPATGARLGQSDEAVAKMTAQFAEAHLAVVVVAAPKPSEKIPAIEQTLSAGAVCLALLNAALAAGWGANWLTGWAVHDRHFATNELGLAPDEFVAGLIHIGTATAVPPDRPRPELARIATWIEA